MTYKAILPFIIVAGMLSIIPNLALAQTEPPTHQQLCKTDSDMIALDKTLGVPADQLTALQNLYNDVCGQVN
jgi:hypothetical protein